MTALTYSDVPRATGKAVSRLLDLAATSNLPILLHSDIFDFRPAMLIHDLGLTKPAGWSYRLSSNYGHFGRNVFPWEKTNRVEALREAAGLK